MSCLSFLLKLDELQDSILHLLNGLVLSESHAALVGDIVDTAFSLGVFTTGTANLEVVLAGDLIKLSLVGSQLGNLNVHGRTDGGSKVGGAESQETETIVVTERNLRLNLRNSADHTAVNFSQITSHLHGNNTEMVLLIAPDKEGLLIVVVDTTASGPVTASIGGLQETITLFEQEVVINKFLLDILGHASEGVKSTLVVSLKSGEGGSYLLFHLLVLSLVQAGVEWVTLHGAATTDTSGDNILALGVDVHEGVDITEVLRGVLVCLGEADVVVLNDGVEKRREEGVSLSIWSVDTDSGIEVLNACNRKQSHYFNVIYS